MLEPQWLALSYSISLPFNLSFPKSQGSGFLIFSVLCCLVRTTQTCTRLYKHSYCSWAGLIIADFILRLIPSEKKKTFLPHLISHNQLMNCVWLLKESIAFLIYTVRDRFVYADKVKSSPSLKPQNYLSGL